MSYSLNAYAVRMLAIIIAILILLTTALKSSAKVKSNHFLRYLNQDIHFQPDPHLISTLPWSIDCKIYFKKYCSQIVFLQHSTPKVPTVVQLMCSDLLYCQHLPRLPPVKFLSNFRVSSSVPSKYFFFFTTTSSKMVVFTPV